MRVRERAKVKKRTVKSVPKVAAKPPARASNRQTKPKKTRSPVPASVAEEPRRNRAARNLFDLLGGRSGVLELISDLPEPDPSAGPSDALSKLRTLRDILSDDSRFAPDSLGRSKTSLGMALAMSGASERDVYQLFLDRERAKTLVTLAAAEPHIAGEVIDAASSKLVLCRQCSGTKVVYVEGGDDRDGGIKPQPCRACDRNGMQVEEGSFKHQELFFDLTKLKQIPATQINTSVTNDNRSITFQAGQPGSAPTPLSMIKSLERIVDGGPRPGTVAIAQLNPTSSVPDAMLPSTQVIDVAAVNR